MKSLKFKCKLLSDVILNQKAATEGPNKTLDFIPGSCFLGIVASCYNEFSETQQMEIFHSGKVRFGDAHPSHIGFRSLKVPAAMYYPKLKSQSDECYISYKIPNPDSAEMREKQLKQCRAGYVDFSTTESCTIETNTNFAIKSAYDRNQRRSKDKKMYGYESLQKGVILYFDIEVDDDTLSKTISEKLVGEKRVGRSRTAQYGLVEISVEEFNEVSGNINNGDVVVYADGRLIFLDENGLPTFQPTIEQLGFTTGEIDWNKSQIRTFQYAPWNYTRQCFDTDRCGIEKGSVFVVKNAAGCNSKAKYIGSYKNEGFGKVIYNPDFLGADSNGVALYKLIEKPKTDNSSKEPLSGTRLLSYVDCKQREYSNLNNVYKSVNDWVRVYSRRFSSSVFPSQWGAIRSIASRCHSKHELLDELFDKKIVRNGKEIPNGYLTHGVASVKWKENGGAQLLKTFIEKFEEDDYAILAVVNLASEMGKQQRKECKK